MYSVSMYCKLEMDVLQWIKQFKFPLEDKIMVMLVCLQTYVQFQFSGGQFHLLPLRCHLVLTLGQDYL